MPEPHRKAHTDVGALAALMILPGLGLAPEGARWRLDASYELQWWQADYGTPALPRGSRQLIVAEIGWVF